MPGTYARKGSWILVGLAGFAAALALYRFRSRPQGNAGISPSAPWFPAPADSGPIPLDWNPEQAPNGTATAGPASLAEAEAEAGTEAGSFSPPGSEPWLEPLRMALDSSPHAFGYGKSAWSAPLLSRYLQDTQGLGVPLPAVRKALKDLGYRWEHTRYVKIGAGAPQEGFTSEGMG